jgi:hypothetical protein
LILLLLPAIQAAREAARRTQCTNQLKQLALGCLNHESAHRFLPTDGWGWRWVGDPDQGYDRRQPGGWVYNILPFIEQKELRALGAGAADDVRRRALATLLATPLPVMNCPSRREPRLYPFTAAAPPVNVLPLEQMAKSDYACNAGSNKIDIGTGPDDLSRKAIDAYRWPDVRPLNGVIHAFSEVRLAEVTDGASKTYMLGEKYIASNEYMTGQGFGGDDQTMYLGDDADVRRWTFIPPLTDRSREHTRDPFGSAHNSVCFFAFCDGSVKGVAYTVDPEIHRRHGDRRDGLAAAHDSGP